jgi:hypothetical protein
MNHEGDLWADVAIVLAILGLLVGIVAMSVRGG